MSEVQPIIWSENHLLLLDQRKLPLEKTYVSLSSAVEVAQSITDMVVRGAPAIGITAAYGVVLAAQRLVGQQDWVELILRDLEVLAASRPTAINLHWALDRMRAVIEFRSERQLVDALLQEAKAIHREDSEACSLMGRLGSDLIQKSGFAGKAVLTHCNTGALATGGVGTALGVIRQAYQDGLISTVYADETRPWLQGARLTAWELMQENIPVKLNADGAAAHLMKSGEIGWVIVGSDRIAANGDVANKIGTYSLAVLARYHGLKFMVVAPTSTIDMSLESGNEIPIEERESEELTGLFGVQTAPDGVGVANPVFDVTPADLVDAIVTEKGVVVQPAAEKMTALFS